MVGYSEEEPAINPEEVAAWKWMGMKEIAADIHQHPEHYTAWFKIIFDRVHTHLNNSHEKSKS
jgi:isopentenyl-diphosphate delta-isomerase